MARVWGWTTAAVVLLLWPGAHRAAAQEGAPRIELQVERANLSFEELQRLVPALAGIALPEELVIERLHAGGPLDALTIDFLVHSSDSRLEGKVTGRFVGEDRTVRGSIALERMDLAALLARPTLPTELSGETTFDLAIRGSGDVPSITGDYQLRADRVVVQEYSANAVNARGRFDEQTLILESMAAQIFGGRVTAEGRVGLPLGGRSMTYDVAGSVDSVNVSALPDRFDLPDVDSSLSLTYEVRDRGAGPAGRARLSETRAVGATFADGTEVSFDMTGGELAYTARGRVSGLDPQAFGKALENETLAQDRFAGEINASFSASGREAMVNPLTVTLNDSRLLGGNVPQLSATIRRTPEATQVRATGTFQNLQPNLAVVTAPPGNFTGSLDLDGTLAMTDGEFDWRGISADGRIDLTESTVGDISIRRAVLAGSAKDEVVQLRELLVDSPAIAMSGSGTVAFDEATPTNAVYTLSVPELAVFSDLAGTDVGGSLQADGEVTGTETIRVSGTLSGSSLEYGTTEALNVTAKHDVSVPPDDPAAATIEAQASVQFLRAAGRTLNDVTLDATYQNRTLDFDAVLHEADRSLESAGRLVLLPDAGGQQLFLTSFQFDGAGALWQMPAGREARIDYSDTRIVVDGLQLETADGQVISASGVLGRTTNEGPFDVTVNGLALANLAPLLFNSRGVTGSVSVDASLTGPLDDLGVDATFRVDQGSVGSYEYDSLEGSVETTSGPIAIRARLQQDAASWLLAEGTLPRSFIGRDTSGNGLDVTVTSSPLGLGFVGGLTDAVQEVQGTLLADVRVTGTREAPQLDGRVTVTGGGFRIAELGTRYTGLDTIITFEPETLVIQEFHLLDENDQRLRIAGRLPYSGDRSGAVTIDIDTDNFEVIDNEMGDLQVSTDLSLTGTLIEPRLEGTLYVTDGTLRVDEIMDLRRPAYYRVEPLEDPALSEEAEDPSPPGFLTDLPLAFDVTLDMPALVLAGRDIPGPGAAPIGLGALNLTVAGDLGLVKTHEGPLIITGDVTTTRGTYTFQDRQFEILRDGFVRFPGLADVDPLIDIRAERLISGVQTEVRISGTLQRPELALSSQPPLDEADILSLIVFNQPANALGTAEQVNLGQRAAALAGGFVASQLAESVGDALELDILEIDTGGSTGSTAGVTVGEQVGERLFLRVRQGFGAAGATQLMLEYEFTDWMRLQSTVSNDSGGSESLFQRSERSGVNWIFLFSY
ncbi:MAG: translocation/assembly module TamB domain-containing protein [Vicinamibacterales bacterium]